MIAVLSQELKYRFRKNKSDVCIKNLYYNQLECYVSNYNNKLSLDDLFEELTYMFKYFNFEYIQDDKNIRIKVTRKELEH